MALVRIVKAEKTGSGGRMSVTGGQRRTPTPVRLVAVKAFAMELQGLVELLSVFFSPCFIIFTFHLINPLPAGDDFHF